MDPIEFEYVGPSFKIRLPNGNSSEAIAASELFLSGGAVVPSRQLPRQSHPPNALPVFTPSALLPAASNTPITVQPEPDFSFPDQDFTLPTRRQMIRPATIRRFSGMAFVMLLALLSGGGAAWLNKTGQLDFLKPAQPVTQPAPTPKPSPAPTNQPLGDRPVDPLPPLTVPPVPVPVAEPSLYGK